MDEAYRDIYHFTLGGSLWDRRITTLDPCESSCHPPDPCLLTCRCAADTDEELFAEESEPEEGEQVETACKHLFSWVASLTPRHCVRKALRFAVGDRVRVHIETEKSGGVWLPGRVAGLWDEGRPYRIELELEGSPIVWAPVDDPALVMAAPEALGDASSS